MTLLGALGALRVIVPPERDLEETLEVLAGLREECGAGAPAGSNPARALARSLGGKIVALYGSSGIMDACAYRWRSQIEENAKHLAFHHVLPEMNHNELVGWRFPEGVLREVGVVFLRDRGDHPQVQRRFTLTRGVIGPVAGSLDEVWSRGESLLCRVLSILYLGDFVSLYMAYLNRVDPTPVSVIDTFKRALGEDPNSRTVEQGRL
jgi:glucose/mannose-6-phosphate isomerase